MTNELSTHGTELDEHKLIFIETILEKTLTCVSLSPFISFKFDSKIPLGIATCKNI